MSKRLQVASRAPLSSLKGHGEEMGGGFFLDGDGSREDCSMLAKTGFQSARLAALLTASFSDIDKSNRNCFISPSGETPKIYPYSVSRKKVGISKIASASKSSGIDKRNFEIFLKSSLAAITK